MPSKAFTLNWFPGHFCSLTCPYPVKFPAQFDIDNEESLGDLIKTAIFAAGYLKRPTILATLTVLTQGFPLVKILMRCSLTKCQCSYVSYMQALKFIMCDDRKRDNQPQNKVLALLYPGRQLIIWCVFVIDCEPFRDIQQYSSVQFNICDDRKRDNEPWNKFLALLYPDRHLSVCMCDWLWTY